MQQSARKCIFSPTQLRENVIMSLFQYEKQVKKGAGCGGRVRWGGTEKWTEDGNQVATWEYHNKNITERKKEIYNSCARQGWGREKQGLCLFWKRFWVKKTQGILKKTQGKREGCFFWWENEEEKEQVGQKKEQVKNEENVLKVRLSEHGPVMVLFLSSQSFGTITSILQIWSKKGLSEKRTKWKENDLGKRQTTDREWKRNGCRVNAEWMLNG